MFVNGFMDKKDLRKQVRIAKALVPLEEKISRSEKIMTKVGELEQFKSANTVLLYWSMDDEVSTHAFVNMWYKKKNILLPCVEGDDLQLRRYTGPSSMTKGPQFGIPEPTGSVFEKLDEIDIIVVPGVAFDKCGNRMGRGRGFYDRLLKTTPNAYKVGVAFDFQIYDSIPTESFDVPMDCVVSE